MRRSKSDVPGLARKVTAMLFTPFTPPPPHTPDEFSASCSRCSHRKRLALELGKVLLGQVVAWALRRWWE